nr:MAG TPA: hypothetical protein [Caudoviricetes sp.]DAX10864.1 MAG TPA: hypothetical protein [Bacteriophage sp.]
MLPLILLLMISSYPWLRNKSISYGKNAGAPPKATP